MDEVVALSSMLRSRPLQEPPSTLTLDAIPPLTRSLPQVHADSTRLLSARVASAAPATAPAVHPAALRLFSSVGFELDRLRRAVAAVDTAATFVDAPPRPRDPHRHPAWLAPRLADDARLAMNAALRAAARDVATADLAAANARLRARLAAAAAAADPPHRDPDRPADPAVPAAVDPRYVDAMRAIALHGDAPSAPFLVHEVAAAVPDAPHFVETLAVVASVARHSPDAAPPAPHMAAWGARVVLEDQFAERVPGLPQKPRLAAPVAVVPAVRDYVRELQKQGRLSGVRDRPAVGFSGRGASESVPLWPQVYFCIRVGNVRAALAALASADPERYPEAARVAQFFRRFLQGRDHALAKFARERGETTASDGDEEMGEEPELPEDLPMAPGYLIGESDYAAVEELYREVAWSSNDPYMRACFVLLLRLELLPTYGGVSEVHGGLPSSASYVQQHSPPNKHQKHSLALSDADVSLLFGSVEDYMWFRLWLCRTPLESEAISSLSDFNFVRFEDIQGNIVSCGSAHFDPEGLQPLLYAFVLVCVGLYDDAVTYLTTQADENLMHAGVHLAVVVYHLRWNGDDEAMHNLLKRYVSLFSRLYPIEAAVYLMTTRDRQVLQKLLRELIVSSGEYEVLLGSVREGKRNPGGLASLLASASVPLPSKFSEEDLESLSLDASTQGAAAAAERLEFVTASELYILAGRHADSIEMQMRNLAEVVDKESSPKRPLAVADARRALEAVRSSDPTTVPGVVRRSLEVLLSMATVFEEFWTWRFGSAWEALRRTRILPLSTEDIPRCERDLSQVSEKYSFCIHRCALELLKVGLIIAERALELSCVREDPTGIELQEDEGTSRPSNQSHQDPRRSEVKSLCVFAGLVRTVADSEVNERIVRIEMLLS